MARLDSGAIFLISSGSTKHVLAILFLVALNNFGSVYDPLAVRAEKRLAQPRLADAMELVEVDPDRAGGSEQANRNRDEPKRDRFLSTPKRHRRS